METILNITGAAKRIGVSQQLFSKWRTAGLAPQGQRSGNYVLYSAAEIDAWAEKVRATTESENKRLYRIAKRLGLRPANA